MTARPRRPLDYALLLGLPSALAVVLFAQALEGASARALWQPTAALVVLGGTALPGAALGWMLLALSPFLLPPALYVLQAAIRLLTGAPPRAAASLARACASCVAFMTSESLPP